MKSHVGMETKVCQVCGIEYQTGAILLDTKLKDSLSRYTVTGYGICQEHSDTNYIHLVVVKNKEGDEGDKFLSPSKANRVGPILSIKRDVIGKLIPSLEGSKLPLVFITEDTYKRILDLYQEG